MAKYERTSVLLYGSEHELPVFLQLSYDLLYGTREGYRGMMSVYVALAPHLPELWLHVAHTGSLRLAVDAMYTKYLLPGQSPDVQWQHVKTYPAMKGMLNAGHPDP